MKKNKKADRIKFVKAATEIIERHKAIEQPTHFDTGRRRWEINGKVSVTLDGEKGHTEGYSVFIRLTDETGNFISNGKCNFHDGTGGVETSILRFEKHLNTILK